MDEYVLKEGVYEISPELTITRKDNKIIVRPKKKIHNPAEKHCKDCLYFGRGETIKCQFHETSCCTLHKKATGLYYVAYPMDKACYEFKEK